MPKINIKPHNREENFDAIAPQSNRPALITTSGREPAKSLGAMGILLLFLFIASSAAAVWLYFRYANLRRQVDEVQKGANLEAELSEPAVSLLDKINQHILLPHGQTPEIIAIEDAPELRKREAFYEYAQDGDALVKFNSLEIIYNPVADVIVNARTRGTVAGAEARAVQGAITIDIRNGAGIGGLAGKTAESFKGVKDFVVLSVGNAAKNNYSKTLIINRTEKDVAGLEKQFKTQAVKDLPAGEQPSGADVVIILGRS